MIDVKIFDHLVDLDENGEMYYYNQIDYEVRLILFKMIINIEHSLKLKILNIIEKTDEEDGYNIVNLFLEEDFNNENFPRKVHNSILKKVGNVYHQKKTGKLEI